MTIEERLGAVHIDLPETDLEPMRERLAGISSIRVNPDHFDVLAEAVWNGLEPMRYEAAAEIARLKALIAEMREVLEPFARIADLDDFYTDDVMPSEANFCFPKRVAKIDPDGPSPSSFGYNDFRRARTLLKSSEAGHG